MFTGLIILFIEPTTTTSPLVTLPPLSAPLFRWPRAARRASPGTLRVARNFTHRFTHRYSIISPPRYFTHNQCGEWKYSNFRGEISYFTHELAAQNCIKFYSFVSGNFSQAKRSVKININNNIKKFSMQRVKEVSLSNIQIFFLLSYLLQWQIFLNVLHFTFYNFFVFV